MSVQLGKRYRDSLTGIEGIATSRTTYLYGCVRVGLETLAKEGEPKDLWFDEQRLVDEAGNPVDTDATTGGPYPDPVRFDTH